MSLAEVDSMSDDDIRSQAMKRLNDNKGSNAMHEWMIDKLEPDELPLTLKNLVVFLNYWTDTNARVGLSTLL